MSKAVKKLKDISIKHAMHIRLLLKKRAAGIW